MGHGHGLESKNDELQSRQPKELGCEEKGWARLPKSSAQGKGSAKVMTEQDRQKKGGRLGAFGGFFGILVAVPGECRTDRALNPF